MLCRYYTSRAYLMLLRSCRQRKGKRLLPAPRSRAVKFTEFDARAPRETFTCNTQKTHTARVVLLNIAMAWRDRV